GSYHGHADLLLSRAGSGLATLGLPDSAGVPAAVARDTITVPYWDLDAAAHVASATRLAAIIVEPIAGNMGCVVPDGAYPTAVRASSANLPQPRRPQGSWRASSGPARC